MKVGLIGSGNMGRALATGWSRSDAKPAELFFADKDFGRAEALAEEFGGMAIASNADLAEAVEVVVLCIKPAQLEAVAAEVTPAFSRQLPAVASILAGTSIARLEQALPSGAEVVRFMPNTPVEIGRGTLCYVVGSAVTPSTRETILSLFGLLGRLIAVDEGQMDVITAVVGSSPAFFAYAVEAVVGAGIGEGLDPELATDLIANTFAGTAELILARSGDAANVRKQVASPGGTTEAGLDALNELGCSEAYRQAVHAAVARCRELI